MWRFGKTSRCTTDNIRLEKCCKVGPQSSRRRQIRYTKQTDKWWLSAPQWGSLVRSSSVMSLVCHSPGSGRIKNISLWLNLPITGDKVNVFARHVCDVGPNIDTRHCRKPCSSLISASTARLRGEMWDRGIPYCWIQVATTRGPICRWSGKYVRLDPDLRYQIRLRLWHSLLRYRGFDFTMTVLQLLVLRHVLEYTSHQVIWNIFTRVVSRALTVVCNIGARVCTGRKNQYKSFRSVAHVDALDIYIAVESRQVVLLRTVIK